MLPLVPRGPADREMPPRLLRRIVVGVDFSEPSLAVAGWVGRHLAPHAEIALVHVTPAPRPPATARAHRAHVVTRESASADATRALRGALRGLATLVGGARVTVDVRVGDPASELATYADRMDADLVVVGANAAYRVAAYYERAMTERLLRQTRRPVLIARNVGSAAPANVLAAVADDADALPVLGAAWMLARTCNAHVAALHVTDTAPRAGSQERVRQWLTASGIPLLKSAAIVTRGEKVRGILAVARQVHAEVIAIGARLHADDAGHPNTTDGTGRLLARTAKCSVLVVPHSWGAHTPTPGAGARADRGWRRREIRPRIPGNDRDGPPPPAAARRDGDDAA